MAEVGSAFVSIMPSAKGFGPKLNSQVGGEVDGAGKNLGSRFGNVFKVGALAAVGGAALVGGFLKGAVSDASDLGESMSKVGVVFGKSSGQIVKASKSAATSMGLTESAYLGATGSLGNLLVSLDIAPKKAAGMSQEMVKLAGDLASFNNVSPEEALAALQSGLTGETEPLKKFGVNMNDATLKAQAMKMGLIETTKDALTPQSKALAAQALIMKQTGTAQGDFARTSGGLANQQRILSAQFGDMKATIGAALLPVVTRFVTFLNSSLIPALSSAWSFIQKNVVPVFVQVKDAIGGVFDILFRGDFTGGIFDIFEDHPLVGFLFSLREGFLNLVSTVSSAFGGGGMGSAVETFRSLLGSVATFVQTQVVPRFLGIVTAVQGFVAVALPIVQQFVAGMRARIEPMLPLIRQIFVQIGSVITGVMGLVQAVIQRVTAIVGGIWSRWGTQIMNFAAKAFGNVVTIISGALRVIQGIIKTVTSIIKGDWSGAWNGIKMILSGVWSAIKGIVSLGINVVKAVLSAGWAAVKALVALAWSGIKAAVKAGIDKVISDVRALPGQIKSALGNLGSLLYSAGTDLIQGMINGVKAMAGNIASAAADVVGNAISAAKAKLGIESPSKVFRQIGIWTMQGLEGGFKDGGKRVLERVSEIVKKAIAQGDKLKKAAADFARSVTATFRNDIFGNGVAGLKLQLQADTNDARSFTRAFRTASSKGLSGGLAKELAASGDLSTAQQVAQMSKKQIADLERLYAQRAKATSTLGNVAENRLYGEQIREQNQLIRQLTNKLDRLENAVERGARNGVSRVAAGAGQRRRAGQ